MNWRISFSKDSLDFIRQNNLKESNVIERVKLALRKFRGERVNINIKKLGGEWEGFYRIRSGKLRIILEFRFEHYQVYIEKIDWRGNVYR
ncbi:MAG: type II toxin-antitoxin system RelE/ParE family toxin [Thermodesulfobacteriota bacterium]